MSIYSYAFNHKLPIKSLMIIKKSFFALPFVILLLGLFIEIEYLLLEKQKLRNDVIKISNNIQELRILEKVRAQFFANLSHELKTPLNIIFSFVQLIDSKNFEDYEDIGRSYSKYSVTLKQNCYRMIRLINNLVDLTKIDSGFMNMNFHNYDIVNLVENIVMSVVPYMKNKNINILFDTMIEELEIKCDSDSIERIILNLLSNSMKFSKESGNILVFIDYDDEFVYIKVKDDGIGICEEKQKSVFDAFVQGDKSLTRKREGSGIGLSLVKSLVLLHDGDISLNSKVNNGTEITIKLPNKKLETEECCGNDYNSSPNSLITKISIEFSDIYDLV